MLTNKETTKLMASKDNFKHNLRNEMSKKYVRAADICRALNFDKNTFSGWYNGRCLPSPLAMEKLCNYFGVTVDEMLSNNDQPKSSANNKETAKNTEHLLMLIRAYNDGLISKEEFMEHKKNL